MFNNPFLKGRRPSRKKALSFTFVDDTEPLNSGDIAVEQVEEIDPNQVTLEDAIDEAIETVEEVKDQMQQTQEAIVDMLSPTELKTNEDLVEELTELAETIEEEKEEELKMDDDTFEL